MSEFEGRNKIEKHTGWNVRIDEFPAASAIGEDVGPFLVRLDLYNLCRGVMQREVSSPCRYTFWADQINFRKDEYNLRGGADCLKIP